MNTTPLPTTVVHADWSKEPRKRWASTARLVSGRYLVEAPAKITPKELLRLLREPRALVGFDFPIGIPAAYGRKVNAGPFFEWIRELGKAPYTQFFDVATRADEITLHRPFYPRGTNGVKREHLLEALGLSAKELFRRCDVAQGRQACPLFWTLGGNQVGRAALTGWKDLIGPAVEQGVAVWPFAGELDDLLRSERGVIVETYPADVYGYVGITLPPARNDAGEEEQGKRSQPSRRAGGVGMLRWAADAGVDLAPDLVRQIQDGFGSDKQGEDRFDAVAGLLGMIAVVKGLRPRDVPADEDVRRWEGWILGRLP